MAKSVKLFREKHGNDSNDFDGTASLSKAERRVRSLPNVQLYDWADQAGSVIALNFAQARRMTSINPLPELIEAQQGIDALKVVIDELIRRVNSVEKNDDSEPHALFDSTGHQTFHH